MQNPQARDPDQSQPLRRPPFSIFRKPILFNTQHLLARNLKRCLLTLRSKLTVKSHKEKENTSKIISETK